LVVHDTVSQPTDLGFKALRVTVRESVPIFISRQCTSPMFPLNFLEAVRRKDGARVKKCCKIESAELGEATVILTRRLANTNVLRGSIH